MLQIIFGFLITLFGAIIAVYEKWKSKNEVDYKKKNKIAIILLVISILGSLLSFVGGIDAINQKKISEKASQKRQEKIDSQSATIYNLELINHSLLNKGLEYYKRLDSSSYINFLMAQQISKQTQKLSDYQSGKGSFCYFNIGLLGPNSSFSFGLYSIGVNPLDNVLARIVDIYDMKKNSVGTYLNLGKLYPKAHSIRLFDTYYVPVKPDRLWLNIFFQTGTREFVETFKAIKLNNKWVTSIVVTEEGKILFDEKDKNFYWDF